MAKTRYFSPDLFRFLAELRRHNACPWFQANRARYEAVARDPVLRFIGDLGPRLRKLSPQLVVDASPVGGSMMRIHRDIRFSPDKSPYKTSITAHFRHDGRKDESTPAFYLHLELQRSSVGAGICRPETPTLKRIRDAMVGDPKRWRRITSGRAFRATCGMAGESLKRVPPGYDPNHPLAQDLKRKDFAVSAPVTDRQVLAQTSWTPS